jgi:hypothetical protein
MQQLLKLTHSVARNMVSDPINFNADPDPAFHFNADPDPAFHFNADPDPAFHFHADPDPAFHFTADPDRNLRGSRRPRLYYILSL